MDASLLMTPSDSPEASPRTPPLFPGNEDVDAVICYYATIPLARVDEELRRHRIDPQPTVDAILADVMAVRVEMRRQLHGNIRAGHATFEKWVAGVMRVARATATRLILLTAGEMRRTIEGIIRPWEIGRAMPVRVLN